MSARPWIMNLPEEAAAEYRQDGFEPDTVCISITEPDRIPPSEYAKFPSLRQYLAVLRLQFHDFDPARHKAKVLEEAGKPACGAVFMSPDDAQLIVSFANAFRGKNFVVHCAAGVSRSGAVVEALLQAFPEYEDKGWGRYPNGHVKALLKRALGLVPAGAESGPLEVGA